jgi:hypothetical protein
MTRNAQLKIKNSHSSQTYPLKKASLPRYSYLGFMSKHLFLWGIFGWSTVFWLFDLALDFNNTADISGVVMQLVSALFLVLSVGLLLKVFSLNASLRSFSEKFDDSISGDSESSLIEKISKAAKKIYHNGAPWIVYSLLSVLTASFLSLFAYFEYGLKLPIVGLVTFLVAFSILLLNATSVLHSRKVAKAEELTICFKKD